METYPKKAKQLILSLIKQRQLLINAKRSMKNEARALMIIEKLKRQLDFYPYDSDIAMARFVINQRENLYYLAPGKQDKRINDLNQLVHRAYTILFSKKQLSNQIS